MSEQMYEDNAPTWRQSYMRGKLASHIIKALRAPGGLVDQAQGMSAYDWATLPAKATVGLVKGVAGGASDFLQKYRSAVENGDYAAMNDTALDAVIGTVGGAMGASHLVGPTGTIVGAGVKARGKAKAIAEALRDPRFLIGGNGGPPLQTAKPLGYNQAKIAANYPKNDKPVWTYDKKKDKWYWAKELTDEGKAVQKARKAAQKDIDAGNYTPYFDVSKRDYVDPANYPLQGDTLVDAMPKTQKTIDKYTDEFDTPETRQRLSDAYDRSKNDPLAEHWYAMKQLEDKYISVLGAKEGRAAYKKDFADGMAATTGGADPTSNLMMAHYGNYLRANGNKLPDKAYEMPFPIGGRYVGGNMKQYDRIINKGEDLTAEGNSKRFNFSANFQGYRDRATIDEQMSKGIKPGMTIPPGDSYGVAEKIVHDLAYERGIPAANFQDIGWAGLKGVQGQPMISHVNEAIERTSRITGKTPEEIMVEHLIKKKGPLYSVATPYSGRSSESNPDE